MTGQNSKLLKNKRIAIVIAQQDFRDEELFIPRSIFVGEGAEVKLVSAKKGQAIGSYGGVVNTDLTLDEFAAAGLARDFEAVVFVGGSGASQYIENEKCWEIARQTAESGKILGAICIAPAILARAGVLKGKKATVWSDQMDKSAVKILKNAGADFQNEAVVKDGNIVTANGPLAARRFGETVARAIIQDSGA